jgi:DNA polymerase-3 subunit epsilon
MREICLDTETTGLDPKSGHKIVEIACVEIIDKVRTGRFFHTYINPQRDMPDEAFRIHGISGEFLSDKPVFDKVAAEFLEFIKDAKLVIHNAAFDLKFLNHELSTIGLETLNSKNVIDSLILARTKFPGSPNSLDALCKRFNIDLSKREKHGALLDTELLVDVYVELMGGAQGGLMFGANKNDKKVSTIDENFVIKKLQTSLPKRDFPASEESLQIHQEFVKKNFKSNFWGY